jgi:hypothetical protein
MTGHTCSQCGRTGFRRSNVILRRGICKTCYVRAWRAERRERAIAWCAFCGMAFKPIRHDARYCSNACRQAAYRSRQK